MSETPNSPTPDDNRSDNPSGPKTGRGLKILLIGSLAINLLIAGAVGAQFFRGKLGGPDRFGHGWEQERALVRGLPRERRRMIFEKFRNQRGNFRQGRAAIGQARREVGDALRKGDAEGVRLAFENLADFEAASLRKFRALMAEVAGDLTAAERDRFAEHLERPPRHPSRPR